MIGARFDDLTGAAPSFRLVDPAGVIEALRAEDVAPAIEAAEGAAARGLWVAGFLSFDAAPGLDPAFSVRPRQAGDPFARLPLAWFGLFDRKEVSVLPRPRDDAAPPDGAWEPSVDRAGYDAVVAHVRDRIAAGDTYQVNYTLRLRSTVEGDERGLYRDLCFAQRGAHAAYLNTGRYRVLSASPELFFRIDGSTITTRPMKGTAPRGRWAEEDRAVASSLRASVKDRAENAMIVDLLRNDLARVARTGSVEWSNVFEPERYETVWQLTSTVSAQLEPATSILDVIRALFPSGSVTGAPKVRTMRLIAELEDSPRGIYCGSVGFLAPPGAPGPAAAFNVAIRTVVVDAETRVAEYGVGGGITWDSSASGEFDEVVAKARVLTARRPPFELLETMRRDPGEPIRHLQEHVARLRASADYFGFEFDQPGIRAVLEDAGQGSDRPVRVRVRLARSGKLEVGVTTIDPGERDPVRVALDSVPVDDTDVFLFHKTSMRGPYLEARARHPDADDVLLVNRRGQVTESTIANVAVMLEGRWWTPPLDCGLLPGIGRLVAVSTGALVERPVTVHELLGAEGIALISDTRGWRRAELVPGL